MGYPSRELVWAVGVVCVVELKCECAVGGEVFVLFGVCVVDGSHDGVWGVCYGGAGRVEGAVCFVVCDVESVDS